MRRELQAFVNLGEGLPATVASPSNARRGPFDAHDWI
jgi:hypothetical protein